MGDFDSLQKTKTSKRAGTSNVIELYRKKIEELKKSLNTIGWDGRWYRRAFTDERTNLRKCRS